MLWHKAWMETRWTYLVCQALILLPSYRFLVGGKFLQPWEVDGPHVYFRALFQGHIVEAIIWLAAAIFLGLGGLVRERAIGSSSLTLSLPVSRSRLVTVRVMVGVLEAITLAVAPWLVKMLISVSRRTPFSMSQAGCCIVLLAGGGLVYFAMAVLISSVSVAPSEGLFRTFGAADGLKQFDQ
jgi:ABC-type transport system involved in multi-copper enzyme maturation permease subunit